MPIELVDLEEQLRRATAATESRAEDPAAWRSLAHALHDLGRADEAAKAARRAIELAPDEAAGHALLGRILAEVGRHGEAGWFFSAAAKRVPGDSELAVERALSLESDGRMDEACRELRRALALDADSADAHTLLAGVLLQRGEAAAALHHARAAAHLEPNAAEPQVRLGFVLERLGRFTEAKHCYEVACAIDATVLSRLSPNAPFAVELRTHTEQRE